MSSRPGFITTHIILIIILINYVNVYGGYRSESEKEEFIRKGRQYYQASYMMDAEFETDDIGGEEVYAQHNAEATDGQGFESPEKLGFKVLDYGTDGFDKTCIYQIITGKLKIKSAIGRLKRIDYAVDLNIENIGDQDIECNIDMGTVFEQKKYTKAQNLAIKELIKIKVEKGGKFEKRLNAFCIDPSYRSPNGEAMNITPFIYIAIHDNDTQGEVWEEVRNLRNDVTETLKMKQNKGDL